jgi:hypothetical protein
LKTSYPPGSLVKLNPYYEWSELHSGRFFLSGNQTGMLLNIFDCVLSLTFPMQLPEAERKQSVYVVVLVDEKKFIRSEIPTDINDYKLSSIHLVL